MLNSIKIKLMLKTSILILIFFIFISEPLIFFRAIRFRFRCIPNCPNCPDSPNENISDCGEGGSLSLRKHFSVETPQVSVDMKNALKILQKRLIALNVVIEKMLIISKLHLDIIIPRQKSNLSSQSLLCSLLSC